MPDILFPPIQECLWFGSPKHSLAVPHTHKVKKLVRFKFQAFAIAMYRTYSFALILFIC